MLDVLVILALSFIPMLFYALILWWFDRYEKEPLPLLVLAFLWGAIPSIILALIMQIVLDIPVVALSSNQLAYELISGSIIAPLTEESVKALAVILLLIIFRREIDSPMDGLIYGGLIGFGFAAVENVFYLLGEYSQSGLGGVIGLAFLRAGIFGINHAMFTGFTGLGVALSLEVRSKALKPLIIFLGFVVAVFAHAMHNGLATLASGDAAFLTFIALILIDWGGVVFMLCVILWAFFLERKRIDNYGKALVKAEIIPEQEVNVLKSTLLRGLARWKILLRGDVEKWWKTGRYYHKITEAAFAWHRQKNGDSNAAKNLSALETEFTTLRKSLVNSNHIAVQ